MVQCLGVLAVALHLASQGSANTRTSIRPMQQINNNYDYPFVPCELITKTPSATERGYS